MRYTTITQISKDKGLNNSFILIVEDQKVLFADTLKYSDQSTKEEIQNHVEQITGIDISNSIMSFNLITF